MLSSLLTLLAVSKIDEQQCPDPTLVRLAHGGSVRGVLYGGLYRRFLGIPFAQPPLRERRFMPPLPAAAWNGTRTAFEYALSCATGQAPYTGSEDCLYLNVYAPPAAVQGALLPVVFFIHGGGFEGGGAGGSHQFGSNNLDPSGVFEHLGARAVYVYAAYRLEAFGFLGSKELAAHNEQTNNDASTGNMGLQDQRMALNWVQENIAAFGGDAERVLPPATPPGLPQFRRTWLRSAARACSRARSWRAAVHKDPCCSCASLQ